MGDIYMDAPDKWAVAQAAATLIGWATLTYAVSEVFGGPVWYFSVALLCFAFVGIRPLSMIAWWGMWWATSEESD